MKQTIFKDASRWSEWLESIRKDVERTFGILKGRFRVLKSGICLHGVDVTDNIWMVCCALNNILLERYRLIDDWDGEMGLFDFGEDSDHIPFTMRRLNNPTLRRNYYSSGMGPAPIDEADCDEEEVTEGCAIYDTPINNNISIVE